MTGQLFNVDFWDSRYAEDTYAYGKNPNTYLKDSLARLVGVETILFPAEGEGRNAVFAATLGFEVSAFDISAQAKSKCLNLAEEDGANLDYKVGEFLEMDFPAESFGAIALIFAHFPKEIRMEYHRRMVELLKPGGYLILEAFSKNHLEYRNENPDVGGPPNLEMLFSVEEVKDEFKGIRFLELEEKTVLLKEGNYHNGVGSVIRCIGTKK